MDKDIRWVHRFNNFKRAFHELQESVLTSRNRELNKLEKQGLIQGFEYTHELAWNVMKDYLTHQGISGLIGSRDSTREAFKNGLIGNGDVWMEMINARNLTSHSYDEELAENIYMSITQDFFPLFEEFMVAFTAINLKENP